MNQVITYVYTPTYGIGSSPFQLKWIPSILWSGFKVDASNNVHDFTLFKFLKDMPTLTSYTPLDVSILNPDLSFKMDSIHEMERILFPNLRAYLYSFLQIVFKI